MAGESSSSISQASMEDFWNRKSPYDNWIEATGVPIHDGYFIEDVRTVKLGHWDERECDAAFLKLAGQEGVTEARVIEIPPGATLPRLRFSFDEAVYVIDGRGLTTITSGDGTETRTFEWQKHSLFLLPRYCWHQLSNAQGNRPARLLHFNYLPLAMATTPDPSFHFANPYDDPSVLGDSHLYSEAKVLLDQGPTAGMSCWIGNFFADMRAWDRLDAFKYRGAGGSAVYIRFPTSTLWAHMSVFPARTYKKAHRHGPGVVIIIPAGEGFSVMWPEGRDKIFIPWHEGSVFVPPDRWFHQHFNVAGDPARYLALHSPRHMNVTAEYVADPTADQIEYPSEDQWIRQTFEAELAKHDLTTLMPEEAYRDPTYQWKYA